MKNRIYATIFAFCVICAFFALRVKAEKVESELPREYYEMLEELPDEVSDRLPSEIYSEDADAVGQALSELIDVKSVFSFIGEIVGDGISSSVGIAARLCGILVLSAIFSAVRRSLRSEALSAAVGFCSSCAVFATVAGLIYKQISMVELYFQRINSLMLSMIPVTGAVWAMGGNVSTAATGSGTLYAFLAVSENICAATIVPVSCICIALAICRAWAPSINLQGLASGIRRCYTFALGFIMTLLIAILSTQTTLSAAADSTAARAAKMVASSVIPVVGGSVSDTLRTVASGVQYMKSVIGVCGIAMILILLLPTLITLILSRFAFIICGSVADLLGCDSESKLIGDLSNVWACMTAAVAMSSVMFIFAMSIFLKTTVAVL